MHETMKVFPVKRVISKTSRLLFFVGGTVVMWAYAAHNHTQTNH